MNKKIIKYLICIILITLALILMPTKQTMASLQDILNNGSDKTMSYSYFKTSKNLFCLNREFHFSETKTFTSFNIADGEFEFPNNNKTKVDTDILKYIITESTNGQYASTSRTAVANYIPQLAIWELANSSASTQEDSLVAKAEAYNKFVSTTRPIPNIEKEGTDKVVIYYYEASSTRNGASGSYTNLIINTINVTGASYTRTDTGTYSGGYNRKRIYTKNSGATEATVSFQYETSRSVDLKLFSVDNSTPSIVVEYYYDEDGLGNYITEFKRINGKFYHVNCISEQDNICTIKSSYNYGYEVTCGNDGCPELAFLGDIDTHAGYIIWDISAGQMNVTAKETDPVTKGENAQNVLYGGNCVIDTESKSQTVEFITPVDITINKTDALTPTLKLPNAEFKIELTNIKSLTGHSPINTTKQIVNATTDSNGQIKLTGILPNNQSTPITITITETAEPTANGWYYKKINPVTTTLTYNSSTGEWTKTSGEGTLSNSVLTVNLTNTPYIDLSGNVWQDGQTGEKGNVSDANGQKDGSENNLQGIIVELYSVKDAKVIKTTTTDANGNYSFTDILKTNEGYKVIFRYNGITYVETPTGTISKPTEVNRTAFNNRFKTISAGQSNDGTSLGYTYNNSNKTSTLNSTIAGHTTGTTDAAFQISAQTATYTNTATDVNCGLVKKNFDLAIGTDVKSAKLQINEKTTEYTYAQIMDGVLNFQNSSSTAQDVTYNLYLYSSDYNYRITDYKTDVLGENKNTILNNISPEDKLVNNFDNLKELEAFVTYSVILKAQTTGESTVDEFVYYYDEAYTPYNIVSTDRYDVSIDTNARKITFTNKNNGFKLTSPNYRVEIDLTFKINEDANGNLIVNETATNIAEITRYSTDEGGLIDKDSAPANGITNGQITKYEDDTDEAKGLNIVLRTDETRTITGTVIEDTDKDGVLEDTEPKLNGVVVQLIEIKKIGGQYYEYIWQETQTGSNIVMATPRNGYSDQIYTYTNSVAEDGKFEFKDFIPGNYIIRYIYGDVVRTTEAYKDDAKTYNGQDYKSTIDVNYNKSWYNTAGYTDGQSVARDNEARRLEVMSHSTTVNTDMYEKENAIIEQKGENWEYHYTWMCAETSRINIPVDANNKATETDSTTASYDYTTSNTKVLFGDMNFGLALRPETNIVLEKHITGLKITPSGTGVQSIVDATADIEKIVNGSIVETKGITDGLATIKSTVANRGFWQVSTDVEELMQGAELKVEYTYVIRNDGERDYLSNTLVEAYENQDIKPYNEVLTEVRDTVKLAMKNGTYSYSNNNTIGTYLGQYYYNGRVKIHGDVNDDGKVNNDDVTMVYNHMSNGKGYVENLDVDQDGKITTDDYMKLKRYIESGEIGEDDITYDKVVSSRVETIEEALNNDLSFNSEEEIYFSKINTESVDKTVYNVVGEAKTEKIDTVIRNNKSSTFLTPKAGEYTTDTADWSRTLTLTTTLATVSGGELGASLPSYIAEIVEYSNAAGRIDMDSKVANLSYVHSDDTEMTLENTWLYELEGKTYETQDETAIPEDATNIRKANEQDEFWGETIIITKPTGEDKLSPLQIALITISAVAALGVGIVLIKKFVLKK